MPSKFPYKIWAVLNVGFFISFSKMCQFPYKELDNAHTDIATFNAEYADICSAAELFEVHVPGKYEPKLA